MYQGNELGVSRLTQMSSPDDRKQAGLSGSEEGLTNPILMSVPGVQQPGCLPPGATIDSIITVEQFAIYRRLSVRTVRNKIRAGMKGVLRDGLKPTIYLRAYLCSQGKEFRDACTA